MCGVLTDVSRIYSFLDSAVARKACMEMLKSVDSKAVDG